MDEHTIAEGRPAVDRHARIQMHVGPETTAGADLTAWRKLVDTIHGLMQRLADEWKVVEA